MSPRDPYLGVARHYDAYGWDWYAPTHGRRLIEVLAGRGLAACRVLDAGCGTGTLALLLARAGHRVTGVDVSESMLEVARGKEGAGAVTWRRGDVTRLALGESFDAIACVADVLNHLPALDEWERVFQRFGEHLRPGGLLHLDVMTCRGLEQLDGFALQEKGERTMIVSTVYEPASRRSTVKITSFVKVAAAALYERSSETISEWGQPVAGVLERLARAGFRDPERLWPGSDDPEADARLALLARRG